MNHDPNLPEAFAWLREAEPSSARHRMGRSSHVRAEGFTTMYLRRGPRVLLSLSQLIDDVITIASIEVAPEKRGQGIFHRWFEQLVKEFPGSGIYVESVVNDRFAKTLHEMGLFPANPYTPEDVSFYYPSENVRHGNRQGITFLGGSR